MYQIFTKKIYLISILKLFILSTLAIITALWVLLSVKQENLSIWPDFQHPSIAKLQYFM